MDDSNIEKLIKELKGSRLDDRLSATKALESIGYTAVPALCEALKDSDEDVRGLAADALGGIKDPSAVPALCETLKDSDSDVRENAKQALGWIGDSKTLPRKILACSRLTAQKRIEALDALRKARKGAFSTRLFSFPETRKLCESVLLEEDLDARTGAQAVLDWMNGDKNLLRASQPDASKEGKELLRAASGVPDIEPSSLLRASDKPVKEPGLPIAKT